MQEPEIITDDGEIIETRALSPIDSGALSAMTRAEIDIQITTARQFPRSIDRAVKNILSLTTMDEETAEEAIYALPRGGKPIRGPSVRLAETIMQQWGNCRVDTRVIQVDRAEKVIVAEATFHDLETNSATRATVRRRIVDSRGRLFSDDMIIVTGNAACSIAKRNAILGGVPKPVWRKAYAAAERVIAGDATTLGETRDKAVKSFALWGVKPEQVFASIGVAGLDDITLEHIPTLRGMFSAIKNGEATVEELFAGKRPAAPAHETIKDPLADDAPAAESEKAPSPDAPPAGAEGGQATAPAAEPTQEEAAFERGHAARLKGIAKKPPKDETHPEKWIDGWIAADAEQEG